MNLIAILWDKPKSACPIENTLFTIFKHIYQLKILP